MLLRNRRRLTEYIQIVYENVPIRETDELHRRLGQDQSVDSTWQVLATTLMSGSLSKQSESIEVKTLRHQRSLC